MTGSADDSAAGSVPLLHWRRLDFDNPATGAVLVGLASVLWVVGLASMCRNPTLALKNPTGALVVAGILVALTLIACGRRTWPVTYFVLTVLGTAALMLCLESRPLGATPLFWFAIMATAIRFSGARLVALVLLGIAVDAVVSVYLAERGQTPVGEVHLGELPRLFLEPTANTVTSFLLVVILGRFAASLREQAAENRRAVADLHRDRERKIASAVDAERQVVARELHDVAAHHMTGMIIQARAADKLFDSDPEQARALLGGVIDQGQRAFTSLRQIVGILRLGEDDPDYPAPMIADIDALVDDCRRTVGPITLQKSGRFDDLDSGVQLTCFRIVQEALSNVIRHAPCSKTTVRVQRDSDAVRVYVVNSLAGARSTSDGQHLGIVGMRERASLMGGELDAGPNGEGEWAVRAVVPANGGINA